MIKKIQFAEKDILGFEVDGKISKPAFVQMMQELIPEIESPGHFKLYVEVPRLEGIEWEVIWDTLKWATQELGEYFKKVDKIAFVTDKGWLRFLASAEYILIPGIEQKSFPLHEKEKARQWLRQ